MMDMMYIAELGGRMLLLSGLLLAGYAIFLRRKADYRICRRMLLAIPILCLLLPLVHFAVGELSALREPEEIVLTQAEADEYFSAESGENAVTTALQSVVEAETSAFSLSMVLWAIPALSVLLLLIMGVQLLVLNIRCRRMARRSTEAMDGIVRSADVHTPFSFGNRIYLPDERLTTGSERMVVLHEQAHIRLGHSGEGLVMEILCRLLWFNPFVWMARRELRDVQEFEADREVLASGTEILTYQTLLLEETMNDCPVFADGFNRSFVRRRFVEMKSGNSRRKSGTLRWIAVVLVLGITGLASAVYGERTVKFRIVNDAETPAVPGDSAKINPVKLMEKLIEIIEDESEGEDEEISEEPTPAPAKAKAKTDGERPAKIGGYPVVYDIPEATGPDFANIRMRNTDTETHLIFEASVGGDLQTFKFGGPDAYLVDTDSGIHYKARRSIPADAWNYFAVTGMEGKRIKVTVVFPRIPDNTRQVALYCVTNNLQSDDRYGVQGLLRL